MLRERESLIYIDRDKYKSVKILTVYFLFLICLIIYLTQYSVSVGLLQCAFWNTISVYGHTKLLLIEGEGDRW